MKLEMSYISLTIFVSLLPSLSYAKCCGPGDDKMGTEFCQIYIESSPETQNELESIWGEDCQGCKYPFCYTKAPVEDKRKFRGIHKKKYRLSGKRKFYRPTRMEEVLDPQEAELKQLEQEKRKFRKAFQKRSESESEEVPDKRKFRKAGKRKFRIHHRAEIEGSPEIEEKRNPQFNSWMGKRGKPNAFRFRRVSSEEEGEKRGKPNAFRFRKNELLEKDEEKEGKRQEEILNEEEVEKRPKDIFMRFGRNKHEHEEEKRKFRKAG